MASYIRQRPPGWFWLVGGGITVWGVIGCIAWYQQVSMGAAELAALPEYDRALFAGLPGWFDWVYGAAVIGGLFGGIALLLRNGVARLLFIVSLAAVVVQFGYVFLATDLLAAKGASAALFPLFIFVVAIAQLWFAGHAQRRGWIG